MAKPFQGGSKLTVGGGSLTVVFGSGSDADRLSINGTVQGPHLTGPTGPTGPQGPTGGGAGSNLILGPADRVITDYGAVADGGSTDNGPAIQACVDDVIAAMANLTNFAGVGRVIVPTHNPGFGLGTTVDIDADNVWIVGGGDASQVIVTSAVAAFRFSERRVIPSGSLAPVAANRPDAFGVLDAGACAATGNRRGFRTMNSSYVSFVACPPMCGVKQPNDPGGDSGGQSDNWGSVTQLTIEWMASATGGTFTQRTPVMGCGGQNPAVTSPVLISYGDADNKVYVSFRTNAPYHGETGRAAYYRAFDFAIPSGTSPVRVAVQLDLTTSTVQAFVNKVQVATTARQNMPGANGTNAYTWTTGQKFATNDNAMFNLGSDGVGSVTGTTGLDQTFWGARWSNTLRYQNRGVGQAQWATGLSRVPTDTEAYFTDDSHCVFFLPFTEAATTSRKVSCHNGGATYGGTSFGYMDNAVAMPGTTNNGVKDIRFTPSGTGANYAVPFVVGPAVDFTVDGVTVENNPFATGFWRPRTANYYAWINNTTARGTDCAFSFWKALVDIPKLTVPFSGRVTLRLNSSAVDVGYLFVKHASAVAENVFKFQGTSYGGQYTLRNMQVDFEGEPMTGSVCGPVYFEATDSTPNNSLRMADCFFGSYGANAVGVRFRDGADMTSTGYTPVLFECVNCTLLDATAVACFEIDGGRVQAQIEDTGTFAGTRLVHTGRWGDACGLHIHDRVTGGKPTAGKWVKGSGRWHTINPQVGDPLFYVCVTSGDFAATPPAFAKTAALVSG